MPLNTYIYIYIYIHPSFTRFTSSGYVVVAGSCALYNSLLKYARYHLTALESRHVRRYVSVSLASKPHAHNNQITCVCVDAHA